MHREKPKGIYRNGCSSNLPSAVTPQNVGIIEYTEMCDPSAAVAISDTLFIVASDEDNVLRVYARENSGALQRVDLNSSFR